MAIYTIYRIDGPGSCYIGYTALPLAYRLGQHQLSAREDSTAPLHVAMRAEGEERFAIAPLIQTRSHKCARDLERETIAAVFAAGEKLLNAHLLRPQGKHPLAAELASDRLRALRSFLGLTQVEFAEVLGCSQGLISKLESGMSVLRDMALAHRIEESSSLWPGGPLRTEEWLS